MQSIRRKINLVICLLVVAMGISTVIYSRGGFSVAVHIDDSGFRPIVDLDPTYGSDPAKGEALFKANCISCHTMAKELTGPALMGMQDREPYKGFVEDWLLHPKETFKKSQYAQELVEKYNMGPHMSFLEVLTKGDVRAIIRYSIHVGPL